VFIGEQLGVAIAKSFLQEENARLLEQTLEMRRELETRKLVERAKGILQRKAPAHPKRKPTCGCASRAAVCAAPMKELAEAIILMKNWTARVAKSRNPSQGTRERSRRAAVVRRRTANTRYGRSGSSAARVE